MENNLDKLFRTVESYATSAEYENVLKACARFRTLAPFNAMIGNIE